MRTASSRSSTSTIVIVATRSGRSPTRARAGGRAAALLDGAAHLEPLPREELEQRGHDVLRSAIDEREVEAVADPQAIEARLGERERLSREAEAWT